MATINNESLGRRIARLRLAHGMTQERLANIANVSAQAVSKWENGQSYPDILLLPLLAKTFDVTVDELLGVSDLTAPADETGSATNTADTAQAPAPAQVAGVEPEPEESFRIASSPEPVAGTAIPESPESNDWEPTPPVEQDYDFNRRASRIRLRVTREGREAVNLTFPLAAARLLSNVANYFPERLVEGVDIVGLAQSAQNAGTGTLIDVDDGTDHVRITLE